MTSREKLKAKLAKRKEEMKKGGGDGNFIFLKAGVTRVRPVNVGKDEDPIPQVTHFYLNKELGGIISPITIGKPCALMEKFEKLKKSKDEDDQELVKKSFRPKQKYVLAGIKYEDAKGEETKQSAPRLILLGSQLGVEVVDLFMDDDEAGDFTDPISGYDLKFTREGTGQFDTTYTVRQCKPSKCPKKFRGPYNLQELVNKAIPTYEETQELVKKFFSGGKSESSEERVAKKKKKFKKHL